LRTFFSRPQRVWLSGEFWKRRLVFWSGGLAVGAAAVAFALAADRAQQGFRSLLALSPYLSLALTPAGLALSVALTRRYFPGSQGSGIPQAMAARQHLDPASRARLLSWRIALGKIALTLLGLATGASVGREGPTVQVGASILNALGRASGGQFKGLILAGSAAGVAAAFNTPLAGIVFAIEEMSRSFEQRTSGLVLSAVIIAGLASLALLGDYTYFGHSAAALTALGDWAAVPLCGVTGGLLGGLFSRALVGAARGVPGRLGRVMRARPVAAAAVIGLLVAAIGIASGSTTYGTGYVEAKALLEGGGHVPASYGILKLLATLLCSISGMPGGIFSPSLAVGAGLGANVAALLPGAPAGAVILLGMVAYFAGVVQAPITAFVIVLEMTDSHTMAIPLMAASLIAYGTSRFIGTEPVYHALSRQFLPKREPSSAAKGLPQPRGRVVEEDAGLGG
jgi:H+/Cl- antiporter ClcA